MRKTILAIALLIAAPAFGEELMMGSQLGTTPEAVKAALTEMGWEVRKLDMEDGMIEAYAVMGGQMAEIYVDPTTGAVVKVSEDD